MKAISPLVATTLLLIITVAGGVIIYNYMVNTLKAPQEYAALSVVSAQMLVEGSTTIVNIKATNIGTATAEITQVKILPDNIVQNMDITIDPGTTRSFNIIITKALNTTYEHYVVLVYNSGETEPVPMQLIK